ncbi:DUF4123 domain-containing protein [Burkholderia sp. Ax-1719]|uniref:DUF4123 domain-containing protein n=1 Tax=Burkholderia sp. Ax-1719 TaxID=2608334 RepID=UPI00141E2024|nr:DUF4123 domain-containing protein [Burkholderia sp. Ax-1719]NIE64386.1 DUF4123 domain-containing protein [Burkholderia sp. Ax-1719]
MSTDVQEAMAVDAMVNSLREWFGKHPDMSCLLAVDPAQRDFPGKEAADAWGGATRAVVEIDHDDFPVAQRPYLVELDLGSAQGVSILEESVQLAYEDRRPASMAAGLGQRIGGWLASTVPVAEVAARWSTHALQYDFEGNACVLRFYDSRALGLIWPILKDRQQQALLGPVSAWHALDPVAQPCIYGRTAGLNRELGLSADQWQQIHRHGQVNRALAHHALSTGRQPEPADIATAVAAAERAERYGLADRDDRIAFIGHALAWHPHFDLHPKVLDALGHMKPDDFYTAAVSNLTDGDLAEIRRGEWYDRQAPSAAR